MASVEFTLAELKQIDSIDKQVHAIKERMRKEFDKNNKVRHFNIPRKWFIEEGGIVQDWHGNITVSANLYFTQISVLHVKDRTYLGFMKNC